MTRAPRGAGLAWALPAIALVLTCGALGLMEPTDARYAEIGREMLASGDWLTPRLNGVTHLDKPPLAYWAAAAGMRVLGVNETGARAGVALAAGFLFWAVALIARRTAGHAPQGSGADAAAGRRTMLLAPLVLASSALAFILTRLLATDVFLAAAVAGFYAAWLSRRSRAGTWMFVALGAGFLAKGPVVFVHTLLPLFLAALWRRDRSMLQGLASPLGWLLFGIVALPWYLVVAAKTPGLIPWLLHQEIWLRYTSTVHRRPGPPWYFVAILVGGSLPWVAAGLQELVRSARSAAREASPVDATVAAWAVVPVLFFSASGSKLPAYVLPELPAMAFLAARALARSAGMARWGTALIFASLAAGIETAGPGGLVGLVGAEHAASLPLPAPAHWAAAAFAAGSVAAAWRMPVAAAVAALVAWYGLLGGARQIQGGLGSPVAVARMLDRIRQPDEPVLELGAFSAALPFYVGRTLPMLDVPRTGGFEAPGAEPHAFLPEKELPGWIRRHGRVWVYAPRDRAAREADTLGVRYEVVARTRTRELGILEAMPADSAASR